MKLDFRHDRIILEHAVTVAVEGNPQKNRIPN